MQRADDADIESWARERDFAALSEAEQALVVATLGSSDAYRRLRATLAAAREALANEVHAAMPDPAIARDLHAALAARAAVHGASAGARGAEARGAEVRGAGARGSEARGAEARGADARGAEVRGAKAHGAGVRVAGARVYATDTSRERASLLSGRRGIAAALAALFSARIPAWQAGLGAAALVAIALLALPAPQAPEPIVERRIVHVPVRDTIVVTRTDPRDESRDETLIAAARPERSLRATRRGDAPRRATRPPATERRRDDIAERRVTPRRAPKDSAIAKPDVERPNSFVGLDNVRLLAQQRRGVTIAEDTSYRAFTFAVN